MKEIKFVVISHDEDNDESYPIIGFRTRQDAEIFRDGAEIMDDTGLHSRIEEYSPEEHKYMEEYPYKKES